MSRHIIYKILDVFVNHYLPCISRWCTCFSCLEYKACRRSQCPSSGQRKINFSACSAAGMVFLKEHKQCTFYVLPADHVDIPIRIKTNIIDKLLKYFWTIDLQKLWHFYFKVSNNDSNFLLVSQFVKCRFQTRLCFKDTFVIKANFTFPHSKVASTVSIRIKTEAKENVWSQYVKNE